MTMSDAAWLEEAARYFENRPTGGEDAAFWANVTNAERCRSIALALRAAQPAQEDGEVVGYLRHGALLDPLLVDARFRDDPSTWGLTPLVRQSALTAAREEAERLKRERDLAVAQFRYAAKSNAKNWEELQAAEARAKAAEEAENETKDCFWAIYPKYLELGGSPVSTEAARSALATRAEDAEAEVKRLSGLIEQHGSAKLIRLSGGTSNG